MTNDTSAAYIFTRRFYELNFWHYEKEKKTTTGTVKELLHKFKWVIRREREVIEQRNTVALDCYHCRSPRCFFADHSERLCQNEQKW